MKFGWEIWKFHKDALHTHRRVEKCLLEVKMIKAQSTPCCESDYHFDRRLRRHARSSSQVVDILNALVSKNYKSRLVHPIGFHMI